MTRSAPAATGKAIPALKRAYQFTRRLRRFARAEFRARRAWYGWRPTGLSLLPGGFTSDKTLLYPGIDDPAVRSRYVRDLTRFRYRMFNGKSGELLTQKDVLFRVLSHHLPWPLDYSIVHLTGPPVERLQSLRDALDDETNGLVALLRSRDTLTPRLLDLGRIDLDAFDPAPDEPLPVLVPSGRAAILRLPAEPGAVDTPPVTVQVATYWHGGGPFVGHAVVLQGGGVHDRSWPRVRPGLSVTRLDPSGWEPSGAVRIQADPQGRLRRVPAAPALQVDAATVGACVDRLLSVARRFPNLRAINWRLLVAGRQLFLIDAANRLDVTYPQLLGPLLDDPRLRSAFREAGWNAANSSSLVDR